MESYGGDLVGRFHDNHWFSVDDSVKSVHRIRGVLDGPPRTVSFDEAVTTADYVAVPGLVLALRVPGQAVLHVVGVRVLRMGIVIELWVDRHDGPELSHWQSWYRDRSSIQARERYDRQQDRYSLQRYEIRYLIIIIIIR